MSDELRIIDTMIAMCGGNPKAAVVVGIDDLRKVRAALAKREEAPVKESLTTVQSVAVPDLWSFLRDVLRQGAAIESQQGQQGYETFIAHIEAEACRQEKKLRAMLAASQQAAKPCGHESCDCRGYCQQAKEGGK